MGAHFGMSAPGALYWLRKLGFSYKKTFTYAEANQEKRDAYQEIIKDISSQSLVYICKDRGWGKER